MLDRLVSMASQTVVLAGAEWPATILPLKLLSSMELSQLGWHTKANTLKAKLKKLLFGSSSNPADVLVYPSACAPVQTPVLPTAMDFIVTGSFCLTNASGRALARKSASSSDALVLAGEKYKWNDFNVKVRAAWKDVFPQTPYPDETPELGFKFLPKLCDIDGETGPTPKLSWKVLRSVRPSDSGRRRRDFTTYFTLLEYSSRSSYCIGSANAQCFIFEWTHRTQPSLSIEVELFSRLSLQLWLPSLNLF